MLDGIRVADGNDVVEIGFGQQFDQHRRVRRCAIGPRDSDDPEAIRRFLGAVLDVTDCLRDLFSGTGRMNPIPVGSDQWQFTMFEDDPVRRVTFG